MSAGKEEGGLGIRNLSTMNEALLGKWTWRFGVEDNSPWKIVIKLKYGTEAGGWFTRAPRGSYGVGLWKDISKEPEQLKNDGFFELGDDCRIKLWEGVWCGETPLCVSFPFCYALAVSKGVMVSDFWENSGGDGVWNLRFNREFYSLGERKLSFSPSQVALEFLCTHKNELFHWEVW